MLSSSASSNLSLTFSRWRVGLHRIKFDEIGFHSTQFLSTEWSLVSQQLLRRSRFKTSSIYWNILFFRLQNFYQLSKMAFQRVGSFPMFRLRLEVPPVWESRRCWRSVSCFLGRDTRNLKKNSQSHPRWSRITQSRRWVLRAQELGNWVIFETKEWALL